MLHFQGLTGADVEALRKLNHSARAVILGLNFDITTVERDHGYAGLRSGRCVEGRVRTVDCDALARGGVSV